MCMNVCVNQREREMDSVSKCVYLYHTDVCVCLYVYVNRERDSMLLGGPGNEIICFPLNR